MQTDTPEISKFKIRVANCCKLLLLFVFSLGIYLATNGNNPKIRLPEGLSSAGKFAGLNDN